ncbi:AMP-binding protein [Nitratireductor aquimarinus]|uniref:AMP-binding protein n=1 Tax=Nitratireductor aquimarinus TaxID=889300 RepID=A0ABU4AQ86_9HYPH|nr:AMP-binding protein [Nitratireductor aquimarinus]MDV6228399.1 AMP-binding protein [Nitratireductor aquimarinus]
MLERRESYEALYDGFRWNIPQTFNIGTAISNDWAKRAPERIALFEYRPGETPATLTYGMFAAHSDALAAGLARAGIRRGDRVALLLPQSFETAIAHAAIYKLGAIAVPLALLFGAEALEYRLFTSGAAAVITNDTGLSKIARIRDRLPALRLSVCVDGASGDTQDFHRVIAENAGPFEAATTGPDDPAMMIFTSGTTGPPKGALHGHRVLLGHLPGVQFHHEFLPQEGDLLWTPADWAWAGGLLNVLLPGLYLGTPVVAGRFEKFDPETALGLMEKMKVRNAFIPPTALRMLKAVPDIRKRFDLSLRTIGSGGEALGRETFEWARNALGLEINEFYGQTECNLVLSSCHALNVGRPGAIGLPVPGHRVAVIDREGRPLPAHEAGDIAILRPDPVMFLGYWENEAATAEKFVGDWMTTGDQGVCDEDGYIHFVGRDDDVITSAGYRIGPTEIEDCLTGHPDVALAAAVGKPDPVRTEIVKAYIVLREGADPSDALAEDIRLWVRERLSAHEYPREIAFVESMPLTTTGKVIRRIFRERARNERAED